MKFRHAFTVNARREAVEAFHRDPRILRDITPFPTIVQFHHVERMFEGSSVDFTLWFGPIPVRWVAQHSRVGKDQGFVDEQVRGPFKRWVHRHTFESIDSQSTRVVDEIEAEFKSHPWWRFVGVAMWITLPILFAYRAWKTRRIIERDERTQVLT